MENHQRSKKHRENLEALKAVMNAEDRAYFNASPFDLEGEQQSEESATPVQKSSKKKKKKKSSQETPPVLPTSDSTGRKKKNKRKDKSNPVFNNLSSEESDSESEVKPSTVNNGLDENSVPVLTDNNASSDTISCDQTSDSIKAVNEDSDSVQSTSCVKEDQKDDEERLESKPKLKGKKAKDARKAKAKESGGAAEPVTVKENQCMVCGKVYSTKNKLFQHIKKEGHAALKTMGKEAKGKVKGN